MKRKRGGVPTAGLPARSRGAALLALLVASACVRYTPVAPAAAPSDADVRVTLTEAAAVRVGPSLGTVQRSLQGRLEPLGADTLRLAVAVGREFAGTEFERYRQPLYLRLDEVLEVERQEISPTRTALAAGAVVAALAVLIDRMGLLEDPNSNDVPRGYRPPPEEGLFGVVPLGLFR